MIYLLFIVLFVSAFGLVRQIRQKGFLPVIVNLAVASVAGLISGVFIGLGARAGMRAIAFANGDLVSFSASGTVSVVALFASFGIIGGLIYEAFLRDLLRHNGFVYGLLLTICLWYPLGSAAHQALTNQPSALSLIVFTGVFVALMWLPFGICLESILFRWHRRSEKRLIKHWA